MAEERTALPHKLSLEERKKLTLTGATEVVRFDEEMAQLNTSQGTVIVQGNDLKLKTLSLEGGTVAITGHICAVIYEEPRQPGGLRGLFG